MHDNIQKYIGQSLGICILLSWCANISYFIVHPLYTYSSIIIFIAILVQTFLYTGLFIVVHDCIHGSFAKRNYKLNRLFGIISATLYGFLDYNTLSHNHLQHHLSPATSTDPDYCFNEHFVIWYITFISRYLSWKQFWLFTLVFVASILLRLDTIGLLLIWRLPALLSSFQLFYFGIYLVHRNTDNSHLSRSRNLNFPLVISIICCYNFGYHQLHHDKPYLSWWQLKKQ